MTQSKKLKVGAFQSNQRKIFHNFPLKQIYKTVHDDYFFSPKEFCILLEEKNIEECFCECYKKDQLAIYDIFALLKLFENFEFQRGGDMFSPRPLLTSPSPTLPLRITLSRRSRPSRRRS